MKVVDDEPVRPGAERRPAADPDASRTCEVAYGPTQVIFDVSLEVPDGGLCCLMGRNGVGKSTLLQTIVGLQPAKAGTIALGWQDITKRAPYDRTQAGIAYVPQGREAFPYLTVYENLRVVAEASDKPGADVIEQALERFPRLRKILERPAGFLSGGEAQQLAIARALVTQPSCCCSTSRRRASSRRSSSRSRTRSPTSSTAACRSCSSSSTSTSRCASPTRTR